MANIHRGEVTVSVAGRAYTLRPTFHILSQIEERIGLSLPELLVRMRDKGLLASEILMLLALATRHDGSRRFDSEAVMDMPADQVNLHALMPALAKFLVQAMGGRTGGDGVATASAEPGETPRSLDYPLLLEAAYKRLGLEPARFWQLTMPEFRLLLRAVRPRKSETALPKAHEVQAMSARFPDRAAKQTSFRF